MTARRFERAAQAIHEERAIGKLSERIVKRVVQQTLDGKLALGDVGLRSGDARSAAVGIMHRQSAREHPAILAVLALDAVLAFEMRRTAGEMKLNGAAQQ